TRDNLADIIDRVAIAGEAFLVTKFGKVKARIMPVVVVDEKKKIEERESMLDKYFGIWKDRKDMTDSVKWVRDLRKKESMRHGKIFN
ncbi:MAG: hypothetical protein U0946_02385, partial [Patescibacteria group bacterium]|nr:hypothetical protein [Patescibacteria group bacterium]